MFSGIKRLSARRCWARHVFNAKVCNVFSAQNGVCPPGSTIAVQRHNLPFTPQPSGPFRAPTFCVARAALDPGGVPNCTDSFGGPSNEAGVLGNSVNQACLNLP